MPHIPATETASSTEVLADFAANLTYDRLPAEVVATLKRLVLDTLGTTLAGSTLGGGCQEVFQVVQATGGPPQSTVLGFGTRTSALMAAFANGALAHALNYDALGGDGGHLGVTALPSPLAAAERRGGVSGKELLAAMAAATELTARLAAALSRAGVDANEKFLEGQLLGYFGAAAGAGRVLGLSPQQMRSAFGLALMQAAGSMQVVFAGDPPAKAIYAAFPNHGGMLSALLSAQGLGADVAAIEGRAGLFALYYGGTYVPEVLHAGFGTDFYLLGARFKPWPTSGTVHPFIEAGAQLARQHRLTPAHIQRVVVRSDAHFTAWCEPLEERRYPQNAAAAANSVIFGVAKALVNGTVTLADFTPQGLRQPEAMQIAARTNYEVDDRLGRSGMVVVTTTAGQRLEARIDTPLGHPDRPLADTQLFSKFKDCAQYAAHPIAASRLDELVALVQRLEAVPDVAALTALVGYR